MSLSNGPRRIVRQYRLETEEVVLQTPVAPALPDPIVEQAVDPAELAAQAIAQAHAEAKRIVEDARKQAEQLRQQAYAEAQRQGLEAGRREGLARFQEEMQQTSAQLAAVMNDLIAERARLLATSEGELVELALTIARRVIGETAQAHAETILYLAHEAVQVLGNPASYQIRANPADARRLADYLDRNTEPHDWELVPDERIGPGGCVVACGPALVDASPETQLKAIAQGLS